MKNDGRSTSLYPDILKMNDVLDLTSLVQHTHTMKHYNIRVTVITTKFSLLMDQHVVRDISL